MAFDQGLNTASRSAKGLFRATGKTAKCDLQREKDDFYPTPKEPIEALLTAEKTRLSDFQVIWEPACGDGAMARHIEQSGWTVHCSDLVDRNCNGAEIKSFYDFKLPLFEAIVTNPPFQECNKDPGWIRHALETLDVEYMALLLPINWPGAKRRAQLWSDFPPAKVYLMRWRIDFTGQGAPPMLNAWYVWDKKHEGETVLRMLDKPHDP